MNKYDIKVGFLGFGNMASAICKGFLSKKVLNPDNMYACARNWERLKANTGKYGINACESATEIASKSDVIIVAVTPDQVSSTLHSIASKLKDKIVVSIAAGCDYEMLEEVLPAGINHISTIPNTPVSIGEGIFICENQHSLTESQLESFNNLFSEISLVEYVDPNLLSIGGTIAGCTPAFTSMMIEALGDAGVMHGLKRDASYRLVAKMLVGTGNLALEASSHPGEMKDAVCSPGGTTIAGVASLEAQGFRGALITAIDVIMNK